jgi:hypothetical protein
MSPSGVAGAGGVEESAMAVLDMTDDDKTSSNRRSKGEMKII